MNTGKILHAGKVYLVGAGPGHPGLITWRGVQCLQQADAVLYDYLANPLLLRHAASKAELICLGRHRRHDVWSQSAINDELVRRAALGQRVVRLKGGDPMIFGRGGQELGALAASGVEFEVVPGVTTASALAAYAGITITDRDYASAVALVTGHEQMGKPQSSLDFQSLAHFPGTLLIYMGVSIVNSWSQALLAAGKSPDTPVLVVRRVSWSDQQSVACTLATVADKLTPYQRVPPPALIVVGEAARAKPQLDWFSKLPLIGRRVVVTRPVHQAQSMVDRLLELGAEPMVQPAIEIGPPADWSPVDAAIEQISGFDHLVFSSANGVRFFLERLLALGHDLRELHRAKLAAIGPATAEKLAEYHLRADLQPAEYRAEALAEALANEAAGRSFLLLRASRGREVLAKQLNAAGGNVQQIVVYRSVDVPELSNDVTDVMENDRMQIDWMTVTSSAIAKSLVRLFGERLHKIQLVSISPITSQTLREFGYEPAAEATEYTADGVLQAMIDAERQRAVAGS